jgi:hypothetical protein
VSAFLLVTKFEKGREKTDKAQSRVWRTILGPKREGKLKAAGEN